MWFLLAEIMLTVFPRFGTDDVGYFSMPPSFVLVHFRLVVRRIGSVLRACDHSIAAVEGSDYYPMGCT